MALDAEELAQDIEAAMVSHGFSPVADKSAGHDWWLALAEGIVTHITTQAEVPVTSGSSSGTYKVV